jgi:hypothetical protein
LKAFADIKLKLSWVQMNLSIERLENIVDKGENGEVQHFLRIDKFHHHKSRELRTFRKKPCKKISRKGENSGKQHFLSFLERFLQFQMHIGPFEPELSCQQ